MTASFLRETFEQYGSWRSQAFIYLTVFFITVLSAVVLDSGGQMSDDRVLGRTVASVLVLLFVVPAINVAFRRLLSNLPHHQKHFIFAKLIELDRAFEYKKQMLFSKLGVERYSSEVLKQRFVDEDSSRQFMFSLINEGRVTGQAALIIMAVLYALNNMEEDEYLLMYDPTQSKAYGAGYRAGQCDAERAILQELTMRLNDESARTFGRAPQKKQGTILQKGE